MRIGCPCRCPGHGQQAAVADGDWAVPSAAVEQFIGRVAARVEPLASARDRAMALLRQVRPPACLAG
jgi:hypothetical protein